MLNDDFIMQMLEHQIKSKWFWEGQDGGFNVGGNYLAFEGTGGSPMVQDG